MKPELLQTNLSTRIFGKNIFYLRAVDSTNKWALDLARNGVEEGTVAIADSQTAGRGRAGRKWFSPEGGLYFSVIVKPPLNPQAASMLVFVAGLAVVKAIEKQFGLFTETKWPNDVLASGTKICGILCEMETLNSQTKHVVIGFGINLNIDSNAFPEDLKKKARSLKAVLGREIQPERFFQTLLLALEETYLRFLSSGSKPILEDWKKHAVFIGKKVNVSDGHKLIRGVAVDVNDDGSLELVTETGLRKSLVAGDLTPFSST